MEKNKFSEKVKEVLKSKIGKKSLVAMSVFVVLHALIALFGIAGVVSIVKRDVKNETVVLPDVKAPEEIFSVPTGAAVKKESLSEIEDVKEENIEMPDEVQTEAVMAEVKTLEDNKEEFFSPDAGDKNEILNAFSADKLEKNEITGDWRAHKGVDVKREEKSEVFSFESGKVTKICDDPLMGKTVEILHKDGFLCVYKNLDKNVAVNENEEIKKGDLIGRVGKTAILEKDEESHLHFEIIKDGIPQNPEEYMEFK